MTINHGVFTIIVILYALGIFMLPRKIDRASVAIPMIMFGVVLIDVIFLMWVAFTTEAVHEASETLRMRTRLAVLLQTVVTTLRCAIGLVLYAIGWQPTRLINEYILKRLEYAFLVLAGLSWLLLFPMAS